MGLGKVTRTVGTLFGVREKERKSDGIKRDG